VDIVEITCEFISCIIFGMHCINSGMKCEVCIVNYLQTFPIFSPV
jgi:hypothetical protein